MLSLLRQSIRALGRTPGFVLAVIAALALGIGGNATIFSLVNTVFLRPLPYAEPDALVQLTSSIPEQQFNNVGVSWPRYELMRTQADQWFSSTGIAIQTAFTVLAPQTDPEQVGGMQVSHDFFPTLGVAPQLGRGFSAAEDQPGGAQVALISHGRWQRQFNGRNDVLGQSIQLDGNAHTIIGVMPAVLSNFPMNQVEVWTARPRDVSFLVPEQIRDGGFFFNVVGRLKPGITATQAQAGIEALQPAYQQSYPANVDKDARMAWGPMLEGLVGNQFGTFALLFGAVGCLLLLACANVANLVLTRFIGRRKQLAVRFALGARRRQVLAEFLTENLLLALLGAAVGLLLAWWLLGVISQAAANFLPRMAELALDGTVIAFTLSLALATGLLLGLIPALQLRGDMLADALKEGARESTAGRPQARMRAALLVGEIAVSLVLLIGASLLVSSFLRLSQVEPGFDAKGVLTGFIQVPQGRYPDGSAPLADFYGRLQQRLAAIPGVSAAAVTDSVPLNGFAGPAPYAVVGQPIPPMAQQANAQRHVVSAGYFGALGVKFIRGRDYNSADVVGGPAKIIINEAFANAAFPGEDPIGRRVVTGMLQREAEIIGVVANIQSVDLDNPPQPEMYHPTAQRPENFAAVLIRTASPDPAQFTAAMRTALAEIDPTIPLTNITTFEAIVDQALAQRRLTMGVLSGFAALALLLATLGVYAVMAFSVGQRSAEFGVRMALGAKPGDVQRMVVQQGLKLTGYGIAIGLVIALASAHLMQALLFGVTAYDPLSFAGTVLLLTAIAALASWLPARRASTLSPTRALRPG